MKKNHGSWELQGMNRVFFPTIKKRLGFLNPVPTFRDFPRKKIPEGPGRIPAPTFTVKARSIFTGISRKRGEIFQHWTMKLNLQIFFWGDMSLLESNSKSPCKSNGWWKMYFLFWDLAYFEGRTVSLRECKFLPVDKAEFEWRSCWGCQL